MINSTIERLSQTARWEYYKARFRLGSDEQQLSVRGVTATFEVDTFREFMRVFDLVDEREMIEDILRVAEPEDVFWDIGANIGTHACLVGQAVDSVVAIEARPDTVPKLRKNLNRNGINMDCFGLALDSTKGTVELGLSDNLSTDVGVGSYSVVRNENEQDQVPVEAVSGDWLIENEGVSPPTIAKIDVEGAEERVLNGMSSALSRCRVLFCEVHTDCVDYVTIEKQLGELEFDTVERVRVRDNQVHLRAKRT